MTIEIARQLAAMPEADRRAVLGTFTAPELEALQYEWPLWARIDQLPPPGDWRTWLLLGGRGSGKTRSSAEWVRAEVESGLRGRIALIGPMAVQLASAVPGYSETCPSTQRGSSP